MDNNLYFALREYCEVNALKTIIEYSNSVGKFFRYNVLSLPVNTDFDFLSLTKAFGDVPEVSVVENFNQEFISQINLYGFSTDMHHNLDKYMKKQFSCVEISTCKINNSNSNKEQYPIIVVGNIKVKSPIESFQFEIFERLALLPYQIIVVPRHPLSNIDFKLVKLPANIKFSNTMGNLESLYAKASLTIMGRVFSARGLKPDDDHNPYEATINSHTLCGIIKQIPKPYKWIYNESGLIHQCRSLEKVYEKIDQYICDRDLSFKLSKKDKIILLNRNKYLDSIIKHFLSDEEGS